MNDMLSKMLRYPVFLDSANLVDLRKLLTDGVADSDVILFLATKGLFTRPWCLLECLHAYKINAPCLLILMKNGTFNVEETIQYINNIEHVMGSENPDGLELLRKEMGSEDLTPLKT